MTESFERVAFGCLLRRRLRQLDPTALERFHVLDVHLHAAGHYDIAGLLIGLAGAKPLCLDRGRGIARFAGGTALTVRGGLHGIGGVEIAHDFGMRGDRLFSQLNLTEDQKAKVQQIHQSFAERNKPLREQLHAKRQELQQARQGDTFNESLATQKLSEMAALEAKLMGERFKLHQEMLTILTPEQKTQLEQAKAQFKMRRGDKPGRGERRINQ